VRHATGVGERGPDEVDAIEANDLSADTEDQPEQADADYEGMDRAAFEAMGTSLMDVLSESGIIDAPRFPAISVTPIAIYRDVPLPVTIQ
jgi:hypothetical protein